MNISQEFFTRGSGFSSSRSQPVKSADLVLAFGSRDILKNPDIYHFLRGLYPNAHLCGCSTAGQIYGTRVFDDTLVATAISFDRTRIMGMGLSLDKVSNSMDTGAQLARSIDMQDLVHVFVLSDGLQVNGSDLRIRGKIPEYCRGIPRRRLYNTGHNLSLC